MGNSFGWQKTAAVYTALTVVYFIVSIRIARGAAQLIRIVTGHEGIHDLIATGGTAIAFVFSMWIAGDFIMPRLLTMLSTSLVKNIRNGKPDAD